MIKIKSQPPQSAFTGNKMTWVQDSIKTKEMGIGEPEPDYLMIIILIVAAGVAIYLMTK